VEAKYVRLFSDPDGDSHFADCYEELTETELAPDMPPVLVSVALDADQAAFFGARAGWQSSVHRSSGRHLFVVITGKWEVTASDGEVRQFSASDVLLVEDTTGTGHASRVLSDSLSLLVQLA
jgi:hypothetical protein